MIRGLTHGEDGVINKRIIYKGNISTGYAPGEGPNKSKSVQAAGFFRIMKKITKTVDLGKGKKSAISEYVLNTTLQDKLSEVCGANPTPRKLDFVCMYSTPEELWESGLVKFNSSGLECASQGLGTSTKFLTFDDNGERVWGERVFEGGETKCPYRDCPDFKSKKCSHNGTMKIFPTVDLSTMPYKFSTNSINTIINMESSIDTIWNLVKSAHIARQDESDTPLQFEGLFGARLSLIHKKIKSGGRDVYVTELRPTPEFEASLMKPIQRMLLNKEKAAALIGGGNAPALVGSDDDKLKISSTATDDDIVDDAARRLLED